MLTKLNKNNELLSVNQRRIAGILYDWEAMLQNHFHEN